MKSFLILFFTLVFALTANAGQPWIFGAGEAVNLTNGTAFKNGVKNIAGNLDPSSTAVSAPSGSMYFSTSGTIYVKQDAGLTTNWLPLGIATTGSLTTINGQSGPNVNIAVGTAGSDFAVGAGSNTITLNLPTASAIARGALSSGDWTLFNSKEPAITSGSTSQYWRGDKTFQTLDKAAVGLPNVNDTSDANKPISTATQTALDLKANQNDLDSAVSDITTLQTDVGDLQTDLATTDATVAGKITGTASSVDSEVILFNGTTGKSSKRATGTGYAKLSSGVLSTSSTVPTSDLNGEVALANGGTNKNMTAVNGGVVYTDADSQEVTAAGTSGQVLQSNGAAAPTWADRSLPAKAINKSLVSAKELHVPNNSLTLYTGSQYIIETGNKNILDDASYEGANQTNIWSLDYGTFIADNQPIDGHFNAEISLTAQPLNLYQDSTLYATQFADGVQGLAMIRARTAVTSTPIYVCPRLAGAIPTSLTSGCVQLRTDNKWGLYKVPFILGGTSNGISIHSNSVAITGAVEVDDAFVGAVDLKQDIDQAKLAGASYIAGTASCNWTRTTTTMGPLTAVAACLGPTIIDSTIGTWKTTDSDLPRQSIDNLPAGKYVVVATITAGPTVAGSNGYTISDGTTTCDARSAGVTVTGASAAVTITCPFTYTSSGNRFFEVYAHPASGSTANLFNADSRYQMSFVVHYYPGSSQIYSSQNANTGWESCGHVAGDFTGFGPAPTNIQTQCKRDGSDLLIKGKFTSDVSTAVEARLALKFRGQTLTSANTSIIPSIQIAGTGGYSNFSTTYFSDSILIEPSVTYMTFGSQVSTRGNLTKANATNVATSGDVKAINARIPIAGWENSNSILGTFNEVMTTPGISKPKTCYAGFGGAASTLAAPVVCSAGSCVKVYDTCGTFTAPSFAATGDYAGGAFASGTFANNSMTHCSCIGYTTIGTSVKDCRISLAAGVLGWSSNSTGGAVLTDIYTTTPVSSGNTAANTYVQVKCEGQAP